jgi:hypothetical protein
MGTVNFSPVILSITKLRNVKSMFFLDVIKLWGIL